MKVDEFTNTATGALAESINVCYRIMDVTESLSSNQ